MIRTERAKTLRFCLAALFMDASAGIFIVVLPYMALSLGADSLGLGTLGAARALPYVLACASFAPFLDRYSRKTLIIVSTTGLATMVLASAATRTLWQLCLIAVLWSVSLSLYWPPLFAWVGDAHHGKRLAPATAAVNVSWSLGLMIGGIAAGALFPISKLLPCLVASCMAVLACASMFSVSPNGAAADTDGGSKLAPANRRELSAVWLGNISACALLGLMASVFPRHGQEIGVTVRLFGLFMAGLGLGRTVVFLLCTRWGESLRDWRLVTLFPVCAAAMVATVTRASGHVWLGMVFVFVGLNVGLACYRSLLTSIEGKEARGFNSAMHEGSSLMGLLLGSFGGGMLARFWDIRAPYLVVAAFALLVTIVQGGLSRSGRSRQGQAGAGGE